MINMEFLYYDKTTCKRCISTDKSIKATLKEIKKAIKRLNVKVNLKEKRLPESKIHLSPSVLINGKDIEKILSKNSKLKKSACSDCCHLTKKPVVNCRSFDYKGKDYDYMPKEMIIDGINGVLESSISTHS